MEELSEDGSHDLIMAGLEHTMKTHMPDTGENVAIKVLCMYQLLNTQHIFLHKVLQ